MAKSIIDELRKKEVSELRKEVFDKKKNLLENTVLVKTGKTQAFNKKKSRKEIARIMTVINAKEILNVR